MRVRPIPLITQLSKQPTIWDASLATCPLHTSSYDFECQKHSTLCMCDCIEEREKRIAANTHAVSIVCMYIIIYILVNADIKVCLHVCTCVTHVHVLWTLMHISWDCFFCTPLPSVDQWAGWIHTNTSAYSSPDSPFPKFSSLQTVSSNVHWDTPPQPVVPL